MRPLKNVVALCAGCGMAALSSCGVKPLPEQHPPDVSQTVAAYEDPDGIVDQTVLTESLAYYAQHRQELEDVGPPLAREIVDALRDGFRTDYETRSLGEDVGTRQDALKVLDDGYAVVRRICAGWDSKAPDEEKNGVLELRATFTPGGPDPVAWGDARGCKYPFDGRRVLLDTGRDTSAAISIHMGEGLGFDEVGSLPVLVMLDLDVEVDEQSFHARIDFRVSGSLVEVRVPHSAIPEAGGDIVLSYEAARLIGVRGRNGTYSCDLVERTCTGNGDSTLQF